MTAGVIQLVDGRLLDLFDPDPAMLDIETIAHATSNLCRFTGHVRTFYSVAQHCVLVSTLLEIELALPGFALDGLLHDATEAFVGDVATPLKRNLADYAGIEDGIHEALAARYDIRFPMPSIVKYADRLALALERDRLMPDGDASYWVDVPPAPVGINIDPLPPADAREAFLIRFDEVTR